MAAIHIRRARQVPRAGCALADGPARAHASRQHKLGRMAALCRAAALSSRPHALPGRAVRPKTVGEPCAEEHVAAGACSLSSREHVPGGKTALEYGYLRFARAPCDGCACTHVRARTRASRHIRLHARVWLSHTHIHAYAHARTHAYMHARVRDESTHVFASHLHAQAHSQLSCAAACCSLTTKERIL